MSTPTVSTVAVHVVDQYNQAGRTLVSAYRTGAHRLLGGAASRYTAFVGARELPLLDGALQSRLIGVQQKVHGFLAQRLDVDTSRLVNAMDRVAAGTTNGIESVAAYAARVESPLAGSLIGTLNDIHMPVAHLSKQIAERIAEGAKQIESRVAGQSAQPSARTAKVARAAKTVKVRAKAAAGRTVRNSRARAVRKA
ncbi:MAG: hypothetical protein KKC79_16350 [Gammaproteobacteria bacterium]|nr:hypothetical protein [Gammaproteobacteria bacterium]MBU1441201.1 hypothetical protein [Gammaproteobacteria bacterium]MBU2288501.1 hypothetical protein [Gammaproteobacteria bacterium]MBU2410207.1 hypothetical protein [Gammaproteobacteria bacterium]